MTTSISPKHYAESLPVKDNHFRVIETIADSLLERVWKASFGHPDLPQQWLEEKEGSHLDLEFALRKEFHLFTLKKDPADLIALLKKGQPLLEERRAQYCKDWKMDDAAFSRFMDEYGMWISLIERGDRELLLKFPAELREPGAPVSPKERFLAAYEAYQRLANRVFRLNMGNHVLGIRYAERVHKECNKELSRPSEQAPQEVEFCEPENLFCDPLKDNPAFSFSTQCRIREVYQNIDRSFNKHVQGLFQLFRDNAFSYVENAALIDDEYNVLFYNAELPPADEEESREEIASIRPTSFTAKVDNVKQQKAVFHSFLPKVKWLQKEIGNKTREILTLSLLHKAFVFWTRFGDGEKLKERIEKSPKQFEKIVREEILNFSKGPRFKWAYCHLILGANEEKLRKIPAADKDALEKFIADMKKRKPEPEEDLEEIKKTYAFFHVAEDNYGNVDLLNNLLIGDELLSRVEKCFNDLHYQEPRTESPKPKEKAEKPLEPKRVKKLPRNIYSAQPAAPKKPVKPAPAEPPAPGACFPRSPFDELEMAKKQTMKAIASLKDNAETFGAKAALSNAEVHFEALIGALGRQYYRRPEGMNKDEAMAFVIDSVRYGSLAMEQLLLALHSVSKGIKTPEQLQLKHDLDVLLGHCRFAPQWALSAEDRKWIEEASKGAQWAGFLDQCELGKGHVQDLLAKVHLVLKGDQKVSKVQLWKGAIDFAQKTAILSGKLMGSIGDFQNQSTAESLREFQEGFKHCCQFLSTQCVKIKDAPQPLPEMLQELKEKLVAARLDDVLHVHLPHLAVEIASQDHPRSFEQSIHLRNVLLLDQMIAEKAIRAFIAVSKPEKAVGIDAHFLPLLTNALGIDQAEFTQEEMEFLEQGRMVRQVVRYPFDPLNKNWNQSTSISKAAKTAHQTSLQNTVEEDPGFTQVKKRGTNPIEKAKNDVRTMVEVLKKCASYLQRRKE